MKTNIFFDFDGTLVDASDRLYNLFINLIPECNFTKDEYWNLKRNKINHQDIIKKYFPSYDYEKFNKNWLDLIESDEYLLYDKLYPDAVELLQNLSKNNCLYLVTARQSKNKLISELERFGILKYFTEVLVTEQKYTKKELIKPYLSGEDLMIGDTGKDINTGKELGMNTVAVTYGFLSESALQKYNPDKIISNLYEVVNYG
ncbi:HAD family hydrolase [bacterium]|nr:HAD family hydrolase [bacterium]